MSTRERSHLEHGRNATIDIALSNGASRTRFDDPAQWTGAAPNKVITWLAAGNRDKAWRAWLKHLSRRQRTRPDHLFGKFGTDAIFWGLADRGSDRQFSVDIDQANGDLANHVQSLVEELWHGGRTPSQRQALSVLNWAYRLPFLAAQLTSRLWWELVERLRQTAVDAAALDVNAEPLLHQWVAGELPWALATLLPELAGCAALRDGARQALSHGMAELLDGEGLLHGRFVHLQQPLVACWTRGRTLGTSDIICFSDDAKEQYPLAVRELLRLARRDGESIFSAAPAGSRLTDSQSAFLSCAVDASDDPQNAALLAQIRFKGLQTAIESQKSRLPSSANHSEWAQLAVFRPRWKRSSPQLAVSYSDRITRVEFLIGRDRFLSGQWPVQCAVDDEQVTASGDWEEICWVSDDDVDYLELEMPLSHGLKIQRQICLAREDSFLFLADAVLGTQPRSFFHTIRLPLGADTAGTQAADSREVLLRGKKNQALVFPLTLPEWQSDRRLGDLSARDGALDLSQHAHGSSLYAALWLDLDSDRHTQAFTWRPLAVADQRKNVARDVALGSRVQFGKKQWLIYRSLTRARNRTLLGHNLASEFLIARFGRDGSVKPRIEVE